MAAMASMMMKAPGALNCGAVKTNSVGHISRLPNSSLQVKCMAAKCVLFCYVDQDPKETSSTEGVSPSISTKVSTKFGDLFAFSGPAPEIINGRAAMLGFVSAIAVEVASGKDLLSQLNSGGLSWFALTAGLMTVGTLVPLFNGISRESTSQPIFSSRNVEWALCYARPPRIGFH
ncbi:early light-induced protein 1, chloroplastic-like [Cryptomeria japonica]|uniref:early light-induced protein 1, chloroplastic-like n=1 Tax=Cryptomeria japonica TaxID=3369 RepID=UPI0027D9F909|nr:early light-induced protein 1, chloroplastic-like [Cryptomeria japonica]